MSKKNTIILTITVLFFGLLVATGTFAFWSWRSNNTNITFNTAKGLKEYIDYDEGESQFAGSLQASNSYLTGSIHSTITISKKAEAANVDLVAAIMMDINAIGNTMKTSKALKWVVTTGTFSNPGQILAKGNFIGTNAGGTLTLVPSLTVTTTPTNYTIWIWLDQNENPSEQLSGETLDTNVWTQIDQVEGVADTFEVTRISANNQNISATAVNSKNNITNYALTQSTGTPSSWQSIAQADQAKVYNLNTTVNATGTWYVWFKDSAGKTTSREVTVNTIDSTPPTCTFGSWSPTVIRNGDTATIDLTCTDAESPITQSKLEVTDLTKSNNAINITSINKTSVTNGYKYTITVTGTITNGTPTISLPANKIKNSQNLGNAIATSGSITVINSYNISYTLNGGSASNPTSAEYDSVISIANPTREGYRFTGWTSTTLGANAKTGTTNNPTTSWDGTLTTNTYFKNLIESGTVTLVANWQEANYQIVETGIAYNTLNDAFTAVQNNQTIRVYKATVDESANTAPTLADTKTGIKLDLYGHTISLGTKYITNNGELDIYSSVDGGILTGANTSSGYGVILNNGTLTTSNTASNTLTIRSTASSTANNANVIYNNTNKTATLNSGTTLTFTNEQTSNYTRYLVNNSGTVNISGATLTNNPSSTNSYNAGIQNGSAGKINMTSGAINVSGTGIINTGRAADSVTISGGSITSTNFNGIYNSSTGTVAVTGGSITSTNFNGIYNSSTGTVSVTGGSVTSTNAYGIYNSTGTVSVTGGSVTSTNYYGIYNSSTGTITIGDNTNAVNTNSPVITSTSTSTSHYGIKMNNSSGTLNFYDGKVVSHAGTDHAIYGGVSDTPVGYVVRRTTTDSIETATLVQSNDYYNYLNVDTNKYYATLNDAFAAVQNNQTIRVNNTTVNESANAAPSLDSTKTGIKLDLYGRTISLGTKYISNKGDLDIYSSVNGGILEGSNTDYGVVSNNGTLTTSNTSSNTLTIRNTAAAGNTTAYIIKNSSNKTVTLNLGTTLTHTNEQTSNPSRGLVNNSGTLNISGAILTNNPSSTNSYNAGIQNQSTGKINMTSGTINVSGTGIVNQGTAADSVIISGGSITSTNYFGIYNSSTGTVSVTGGNITSTNSYGIYNYSTGTITIGDNANAVNTNSPVITSTSTSTSHYGIYMYNSSGVLNFYDGKVVSHAGTDHAIYGTVSDTPTGYMVVKSTTDNIETATLFHGYNIEYNLDGGTASNPTVAEYDSAILIANPTKEGYMFTGWTSTTLGTNAKTGTTNNPTTSWDGSLTTNTYFKNLINSGTVTLVANWQEANYQIVETGIAYNTLNAAFAAVQNNQTIRVYKATIDESANTAPTLASTKTGIKLDLYGHTISLGTNTLTNNGTLDIYSSVNGGVITGANTSSTSGVVLNNGTLTTSNTASNTLTIQNTASSAVSHRTARTLVNNANKVVTLNSGTTVTMVNILNGKSGTSRSIIQNSGTLNINGATLTNNSEANTSYNRGIHNASTGIINMTSGTINTSGRGIHNEATGTNAVTISNGTITASTASAVYNDESGMITITGGIITGNCGGVSNQSTGTVTLGIKDSTINLNSPTIVSTNNSGSGECYGVNNSSTGKFNFYDGKIQSHNGTGWSMSIDPDDTPVGYITQKTTTDDIETAILVASNSYYNYQNIDTGIYYEKLYKAFSNVESNQTIRAMATTINDTGDKASVLASDKTGVKFDINGKTVNLGTNNIENNGELDIYSSVDGGLLYSAAINNSTSTHGLINNNGTLTTSNTASNTLTIRNTISSNMYHAQVIYNKLTTSLATLKTGTTLEFSTACVYDADNGASCGRNNQNRKVIENGGIVNIAGAIIRNNPDATTTYNRGINNSYNGKTNIISGTINTSGTAITNTNPANDAIIITGGTITSTKDSTISYTAGGLTLGTNNSSTNSNDPVITSLATTSSSYGINNNGDSFNFYDGKVVSHAGTDHAISGGVSDTPVGYIVTKTTTDSIETATLVQSNDYYNYLNVDTNKYYATLNDAFSKVQNNQTIRVNNSLADESANNNPTLESSKTGIKLDLYGHTITMGTKSLTNNGELDIYSSVDDGVIEGTNTGAYSGVIINDNGVLTVNKDSSHTVTLRSNAPRNNGYRSVMYLNAATTTINSGVTLVATNADTVNTFNFLIRNVNTTSKTNVLYINGATFINNPNIDNPYNHGIYNSGTLNMTSGTFNVSGTGIDHNGSTTTATINGGTITTTGGTAGVAGVVNESTGTVTINDGTISGKWYGLYNNSTGTINVVGGTITGYCGIYLYGVAGGTLNIGTDDGTVNTNSPIITGTATGGSVYGGIDTMRTTNTFNFYDGRIISHRGENYAISANIEVNTPTGYIVRKTVSDGIETATLSHGYRINYTLNGGSASNPTSAETNTIIQLANPTKSGYLFTGWTSTTAGSNAKTGTTSNPTTSWDGSLTTNTYFKDLADTGAVTMIANWTEAYINVDTNEKYPSLNDAFAAVSNNQTIRVLGDVDETNNTAPTLADTKSGVKLDLYGHTIDLGTKTLTNNGGLEIYSSVNGGIITGANTTNTAGVILNNGTLETSNTASNTLTIRNTAAANQPNARVIVNNSGKTITLKTGTTVTMTTNCSSNSTRYLIQNSGMLNINSASLLNQSDSTNVYNRGIYSTSTGKINMTSGTISVSGYAIYNDGTAVDSIIMSNGTITSTKSTPIYNHSSGTITIKAGTLTGALNGVYLDGGALYLGEDDGTVNTASPTITSNSTSGSEYGVVIANGVTFNFYDGKIVAKSGAGHTINGSVNDTPVGYMIRKTLNGTIETADLLHGYVINYNLNSGTGSNPTSAEYDTVVELMPPTRANYAFTGWTSTTLGANAKTGATNNPTDSWDGSLTKNTYFKNLGETGTVTLVANWIAANYLNVDTGEYYENLYDAFSEVENNQTIRVTGTSITETYSHPPSLESTKTGIKLDLYGHTINVATRSLTNNGDLEIYSSVDGGIITGANTLNTEGVITNWGTLTTSNTASNTITIRNTAAAASYGARVFVNKAAAELTINSGTTVTMTVACNNSNNRYLIGNSGTFYIYGATLTNNPSATTIYNGGIYNYSTGIINMTSGTISVSGHPINTASTQSNPVTITGGSLTSGKGYGIYNSGSGTITIGKKDGTVSASNPSITSNVTSGTIYGVYLNGATLRFYDGEVISKRGSGYAISSGVITDTEVGYIVTKTLDGTTETATLTASNAYYNYLNVDTGISFDKLSNALGAVQSNQTIRVVGESITETSGASLATEKTGVKLDLYGHTVAMGTNAITNNGSLEIYSSVDGGVLTSNAQANNATTATIINKGTLVTSSTAHNTMTLQNGAAAGSYGARVILNNADKTVTLNEGTNITATTACSSSNTRYLIQNNGNVIINNATLTNQPTATNTYNRAINNLATGSVTMNDGTIDTSGIAINSTSTVETGITIVDGTITSRRDTAIYSSARTSVIIGVNDNTVSTTKPEIKTLAPSNTYYGVRITSGRIKMYDGVVSSTRGALTSMIGGVNDTPVGYAITRTVTSGVETAILEQSNNYYNYVNVTDGKYYATLYDATWHVTNRQIIRVNNETVNESSNIAPTVYSGYDSIIDLYGHTISMGTKTLTNSGTLEIYSSVNGGVITGSNTNGTAGVITNNGTLTVNDTDTKTLTIQNTAAANQTNNRVIVNNASKTATINEGVEIKMTTDCSSSTSKYLIQNSGVFNLVGGTLTNYPTSTNSYNRGINNLAAGKINMTSGTINTSGYSIYSVGTAEDAVNISGGTIIATKSTAVANYAAGTVTITGGTVTSQYNGVYINDGALILGENDNTVNKNSPVITSNNTTTAYYGVRINSSATFNFYDGKIVSHHGTGYAINGTVTSKPEGYRVVKTTNANVETAVLEKIIDNVYINKDGSAWNDSGMVIYLSTSATENDYNYAGGGSIKVNSGNVAQFENLPAGTKYYIWASPGPHNTISAVYTGESFTTGNANKTINYYTFGAFLDNNIARISLDGNSYNDRINEHVVLDNHIIDIEVTPNSSYYVYEYEIIDEENNVIDTITGSPTKYQIQGSSMAIALYSRQQNGNYQNLATGTGYTTLNAALSAAASNQIIIANVSRTETANATLPSGVTNVKLDLNGKTINMDTFSIQNNGELDIYSSSGNGTITGTNTSNGIIYNNGDFTINKTNNQNSVTISNTSNSNSARAVVNNTSNAMTLYQNVLVQFTTASSGERPLITNNGTININGAVLTGLTNDIAIKNTSGGAHINMDSGSINTGYVAILNSNGTDTSIPAVKITGGTVTGVDDAIVNDASGTVSIQGGNIVSTDGEYGTIRNNGSGRVEIINGTISSAPNGGGIFSDAGIVNISGGTVNGGVSSFTGSTLNITGGNINDGIYIQGTADITGGTITSDITSIYIYSGGILNLGTTDTPVSQDSPLVISTATSSTYYTIDNSGGTFNYYDGKLISNAGTNHTINGTVSNTPSGYTVKKAVNNGVETAILYTSYNIYIKKDDSAWNDSGVTVYLSTSAEENNYDILGAGSKTVTTGNVATFDDLISGTTYYIWATTGDPNIFNTSEYTGISFTPTANGNSTINYYTLAVKAGDANVTGITAEGKSVSLSTNSWIESGLLDNHKINMSITTTTDYYVYKYDLSDGANVIDTIYQTPSEFIIDGEGIGLILHSMAQSGNYQNLNTGDSYATLYAALQAVNNDETIRANASVNESSNTAPTLAAGKTGIKLDLNGKTITLGTKYITNGGELDVYSSVDGAVLTGSNTSASGGVVLNNGTLTISNTASNTITIQNTATAGYYNSRVIVNNSGKTLTIKNGATLQCTTSATGGNRFIIQNNSGIVNINGATISNNPTSTETSYNKGITSNGRVNITSGSINTSSQGIYSNSSNANAVIMSGGSITSGSSGISNDGTGTITISGGTIISKKSYTLLNNKGGTFNITGGTFTVTESFPGMQNASTGTINFYGGTITTKGIGIYNSSTGKVNVTGGTISGETGGILSAGGTLTLGTNDSTVTSSPKIVAKNGLGVDKTAGTFNFYDGIIIAKEGQNYSVNGAISNTPTGYEVVRTIANDSEVASLAPISRMRSASEIINGQSNGGSNTTFLNTSILRGEIGTITFAKTIPSGQTLLNGTDISEHTDGSVMMYEVSNGAVGVKDYYIIQSGGVHFPVDSSYLFYHLPNLDNFYVDTQDSLASINYVTNTSYMFAGDSSLIDYRLYGPGISLDSVIDMTGMFMDNTNMKNIDIGHEIMPMTTENLESMNSIFALNNSLNTVSLRMSTSKDSLTNLIAMFDNTTNIQNIYGIENIKYNANTNLSNMLHNANNLSTNTTNNILKMLLDNKNYTGTKTLRSIGINQTTANNIVAYNGIWPYLSVNGWTTGY